MLFPWVGLLEQIRLSDIFVHYDDVQFSKGGFVNRVQVKVPQGIAWMTVPLQGLHLGQKIDEVDCKPVSEWKGRHIELLERSFAGAPHAEDAIRMALDVYGMEHSSIGSLARASMLALVDYFSLSERGKFVDVRGLGISGSSSERVLAVVKHFGADIYVTGHGASKYLDHSLFEREGVAVEYMKYASRPYPQLHGQFTPFVSALDLVANCGREGIGYICSETINWRDFKNVQERRV